MTLLPVSVPLWVLSWKVRAVTAIAIAATDSLDEGYPVVLAELRASVTILTKTLDFNLISD